LKFKNSGLNAKMYSFGRLFNKYTLKIVITGRISTWPFNKPIAMRVIYRISHGF
jgi:hypothetical protein